MAEGTITRQDIVTDDALQFGAEYAKNVQLAINKNDELKKSALGLFDIYKQLKGVTNENDFKTINQQQIQLTQNATKAYQEQSNALKAISIVWKEQDQLEKNLISTKKKNELATESTNRALIKERETLRLQNLEIKRNLTSMGRLTNERDKARKSVQELQAKLALGKKLSDQEQRELAQSTAAFEKYNNAITVIKTSTKQFQENVGNYPKQLKVVGGTIRQLLPILGLASGLKLAFDFAKEARQAAIEAKGVEFAFKRLGDEGENAFLRIKKSTRGLLSDLDIKKALVDFDNFNISLEETDTLFEFLAVRSQQTGKSIEDLQSSLVEGLSKESKLRIDNLGIATADLNAELEKTPNFVQAVANIAKREVAEAGSILDDAANSQAKWNADLENFQLAVGKGFVAKFSNAIYELGSNILRAITPAENMTKQFEDQAKYVIDLEKNLIPLVDEYDNLKGKTELSVKEQDRLKTVITDISKIAPTVTTQFDEYGNALDISSEKARDFISTQQALLKFRNQEAIKEQTEDLEGYRREIAELNAELNRRNSEGDIIVATITKQGSAVRKLNAQEIADKQAKLARLQQLEAGALESIDQLSGDYLDKYIAREKAKTEALLKELQDRALALDIDIKGKSADELKKLIAEAEKQLSPEELKRRQKALEEARKQALQDEFNYSKALIQANIDSENEILNNKNLRAGERLSANLDLFIQSKRLLDLEKAYAIKNAKGRVDEIKRIELEYTNDLAALEKQRADNSNAVLADEFTKVTTRLEIRKKAEEDALNAEIVLLQEQLTKKEITVKEYEEAILKIKRDAAIKALEQQIEFYEAELNNPLLSPEQRILLEEALANTKIALSNLVTDNFISDAKTQEEAEKKLQEFRKKAINETSNVIAEALDLDSSVIERFLTGLTEGFENAFEAIQASVAVAGEVIDSLFDAKAQRYEEDIQRNNDYYTALLDNENLTEQQRSALEAEREQKNAEIEKKKRESERKAAVFSKVAAITEVGIDTARKVAAIKTQAALLAANPFTLPAVPIALAQIPLVLGFGALAIAAIAAKPIPKYAIGTEYHPGGPAEVAENVPEVIQEPGKKPFIQHKRAVLNLAKGSKVYPSVDAYEKIKIAAIMTSFHSQKKNISDYELAKSFDAFNDANIVGELKENTKAVKNLKLSVNMKSQKSPDISQLLYKKEQINWS